MKQTNTMPKEISRLYQLGKKKPMDYRPSMEAQTMMNLYFMNKHGIKNPRFKQTIQDYCNYSRFGSRFNIWRKIPDHIYDYLEVHFNKKDDITGHNMDEYAEALKNNILQVSSVNPGKKIAVEFNSFTYVDGVIQLGHAEMCIFDPAFNTLEYIDSNNVPKQCARQYKRYFEWQELRQATMRRVVSEMPSRPLLITNSDIYDGYAWGIQSLECTSSFVTEIERNGGYCVMWAQLFSDLSLTFPEICAKDIVRTITEKSESKNTRVEYANDFMLFVIRGYVIDISTKIGVDFANMDSIHSACSTLALGL